MPVRLEDLAQGMVVHGLTPGQPVTVQSLRWIGQNAVDVIYRTILVLVLALSHAVCPAAGAPSPSGEMLA